MREVADGFNGCYSDLAGFVKTLRKSSVESEPVVRLETQAGYQANMAFGTSKTPTSRGGGGGGHALQVVLGHSRPKWFEFYPKQNKCRVKRRIHDLRGSFLDARPFFANENLVAQSYRWLENTVNGSIHRTIEEVARTRFERDERHRTGPLASGSFLSGSMVATAPNKDTRSSADMELS